MNIGFHHRRIQAQLAARDELAFLRQRHQTLMNLFDDVRPQRQPDLAQRLGVGHFLGPDAGEQAIGQVGAHLTLQGAVTSANVLEQQPGTGWERRSCSNRPTSPLTAQDLTPPFCAGN